MWIDGAEIRGFGCIEDLAFEFPRGKAALILADNEHGKSTLAAAILAGICGFPKRKLREETIKQKDAFKPWTGEAYSILLRIEADGRRLAVERDFARDRFLVRDLATNRDISSEFQEDLAVSILKLPRDDFLRIAFIAGKDVHRFGSSVRLKSRLAEVVEGSKDADAEAAIAAIVDARYALGERSLKIKTAIERLSDARDKTRLDMSRLDAEIDASEDEAWELDGLYHRHADLTARLAELDLEYRQACLAEVRQRLRSMRDEAEAVAKLRAESDQLAEYSTFPAERADQLTRAAARRGELETRLQETEKLINASQDEAARIRAAVDQTEKFASATEQDVAGLGGCVQEMENTAKIVNDLRIHFERLRRAGATSTWAAVTAVGCVGAFACIGLMILQPANSAAGMVGAIISGLVCVLGLVSIARGGRQRSEIKARLAQAQEYHESATGRATRLLSILGTPCEGDGVIEIARRTQAALSNYLADRRRLADLLAEIASLEREAAESQRKIAEEDSVMRSIFHQAKIDPALPFDEARPQFDEGLRRWRRYREVKDSLLPALESRLIPREEVSRLEALESDLTREVGEEALTASPSSEVEHERQSTRQELDSATNRLRELEGKIGTLVENYRRRYPALQEEVEELENELAKVTRFGQALDIAGSKLREVAQSTRRRWATALNDRASLILPRLNPDYDTLLFDDQLDFTVRRAADNRIIEKTLVDACLSTGAKDQIYLAARLACAAELSSGEAVPVILDDALMSFDDRRFESALRCIVEKIASEQQVIILSCHKSRHERFAEADWFRKGVEMLRL